MFYDIAILDGSNVAYKAFATHRNFSVEIDRKTVYTGTCYGFIQSLLKLKKEYLKDNSKIFVAWDRGYNYRSKIYSEYKQNRKYKPPEKQNEFNNFIEQKRLLDRVLPLLGITQVYKKGEEADDIVGTLASLKSKNKKVLMVSSDHDFYQLITENAHLLSQKSKKNINLYDPEEFKKQFGILPSVYIDVMSLTGCSGDNVPGVKGVAEKTAVKILNIYPNLIKDIISNKELNKELLSKLPNHLKNKVLNNIETIKLANSLVKIRTSLKEITYRRSKKNIKKLEEIFEILEFNSFLRESTWNTIKKL